MGVVEEVRAPWGFCSCPVCACPSPRPWGGGLCCGAVASGAVGVEEGCSTRVLREELWNSKNHVDQRAEREKGRDGVDEVGRFIQAPTQVLTVSTVQKV